MKRRIVLIAAGLILLGGMAAAGAATHRGRQAKTPAAATQAASTRAAADAGKPADAQIPAKPIPDPDRKPALVQNPYHEDELYFTDDRDCWQMSTPMQAVDDYYAPAAAMFCDQVRIVFPYDGKTWMLQMRKGQYGFLFLGGEIGVFTAPCASNGQAETDAKNFTVPAEDDWLQMSMDLYTSKDGGETYRHDIRPYDAHWWLTGYRAGQMTEFRQPHEEVRLGARITFRSPEMAAAFAAGLADAGFTRAPSKDRLTEDSCYVQGADVWLLWETKNYDALGASEAA